MLGWESFVLKGTGFELISSALVLYVLLKHPVRHFSQLPWTYCIVREKSFVLIY